MFGRWKKWNQSHLLGLFVYFIVPSMVMATTVVAKDAPVGKVANLTERFLKSLKAEVIEDLETKIQTHFDLIRCFRDPSCEEADEILDKYREYRVYAGLAQYNNLAMRLWETKQTYMAHPGTVRPLHYSMRNQEGREEWELIHKIHIQDKKSKMSQLAHFVPSSKRDKYHKLLESVGGGYNKYEKNPISELAYLVPSAQRKKYYKVWESLERGTYGHYAGIATEYLAAYPFFGRIQTQKLDRKDMIKHMEENRKDIMGVIINIKTLEGEKRFELMGFATVVERSISGFSEEEGQIIAKYLEEMNEKTGLWGRFWEIVTNWKLMAMLTCHTTTYALAVVAHPLVQASRLVMGLICSSIGVTLTVQYMYQSTKDLMRQLGYRVAGHFDDEFLKQYIHFYMTVCVMSMVYIIPSLPGIKKRIVGIKKNTDVIRRAYRMNKLSISNMLGRIKRAKFNRKNFMSDVKALEKSYRYYYGEELALQSLMVQGGRYVHAVGQMEHLLKGYSASRGPLSILSFSNLISGFSLAK